MILVPVLLSLPLVGLAILLADSEADVHWEHHPSHFWLVFATGRLNAFLGDGDRAAARRRGDARVYLVSLAFLAAAGFLGCTRSRHRGSCWTRQRRLRARDAGRPRARRRFVAALGARPGGAGRRSGSGGTRDPAAGLARHAGAVGGLPRCRSCRRSTTRRPRASRGRSSGSRCPRRALRLRRVAIPRALVAAPRAGAARDRGLAAFVLLAEALVAIAFARNWHATLVGVARAPARRVRARGWRPAQWHEERFATCTWTGPPPEPGDHRPVRRSEGLHGVLRAPRPEEVSAMLNAYFRVAIPPIVRRHGARSTTSSGTRSW